LTKKNGNGINVVVYTLDKQVKRNSTRYLIILAIINIH